MPFENGNQEHEKADRDQAQKTKSRKRMVTQQIIAALNEHTAGNGPTRLRKIVDALLDKAADGDVQAIKEVIDRIEGKPTQATEVSGKDGGPLETVQRIERVIVDAGVGVQHA